MFTYRIVALVDAFHIVIEPVNFKTDRWLKFCPLETNGAKLRTITVSLKHLVNSGLNLRRRQVSNHGRDSPFMSKRVSDSAKSLSPKHVVRLHHQFGTVGHHLFDDVVAIIHIKVDGNGSRPQASRTGGATVFGEFFTDKESTGVGLEFAMHDPSIRHGQQVAWSSLKHGGIKLDRFVGTSYCQIRHEFTLHGDFVSLLD